MARKISLVTVLVSLSATAAQLQLSAGTMTLTFSATGATPTLSSEQSSVFAVTRTLVGVTPSAPSGSAILWQILAVTDESVTVMNTSTAPFDAAQVQSATYEPSSLGIAQNEVGASGIQLLSSLLSMTRPTR